MRHYTDDIGRRGIERLGLITPSADGRVYLSPDAYVSGVDARDRLALRGTPTGYFVVPDDRLEGVTDLRRVEPAHGLPGGGSEVYVTHAVDASGLPWIEVGP